MNRLSYGRLNLPASLWLGMGRFLWAVVRFKFSKGKARIHGPGFLIYGDVGGEANATRPYSCCSFGVSGCYPNPKGRHSRDRFGANISRKAYKL